jgi:hypothetical protein
MKTKGRMTPPEIFLLEVQIGFRSSISGPSLLESVAKCHSNRSQLRSRLQEVRGNGVEFVLSKAAKTEVPQIQIPRPGALIFSDRFLKESS